MELIAKRPLDELTEEEAFKRRKLETAVLLPKGVERTSDLPSPIILLTGHEAEIYTLKFAPDGRSLASAGADKRIFLWHVFGDCSNYAVLKGHTNAIMELHWSHEGDTIFTCSADKTLQVWDVETLSRRKKLKAHDTFINTCCPARRNPTIVASGADDSTAKIWDLRAPRKPSTVLTGKYPVTSVQFSDQNDQIFVSDTSGVVNVWDLKRNAQAYQLTGHTEIITGSKLSPNGQYLLTNSMDNIVRAWDVRPFVQGGEQRRCIKVFGGHMHNVEKNLLKCNWSPDGKYVSAGSGDQPTHVYIWDFETRKVEYKLPGHSATVNEVDFHPTQPIVGSCSSDKTIYIGELAKNTL